MARAWSSGRRVLGDYIVGEQIGSGSYSVVWRATHRVHGYEYAIKEINMERLNKKLQESLLSEIVILKTINHPNIIRLHDIIETSGRIHLVLEFCKGGDLSMYINRHGRVPQATAKHFLQQLAAGLQVLRENNVIHRDLKPQNLLLSTNDSHYVLKIADFGFARSLHPRGLAETLCGSPLYMAPEIMQFQKYDAKADLWSVGAILYQLVTAKTPFSGNDQIQLLQNIKTSEVRFPSDLKELGPDCIDLCQKLLRRNPVERLTFEEFFNHPFLSHNHLEEPMRTEHNSSDGFSSSRCSPARQAEESSQEDCLPFLLDDDTNAPGSPPFTSRRASVPCTSSRLKTVLNKRTTPNTSTGSDVYSRERNINYKVENDTYRQMQNNRASGQIPQEPTAAMEQRHLEVSPKVVDSLELSDQDYVFVLGPSMEVSSSSGSASRLGHSPVKSMGSPRTLARTTSISAPMPIVGATVGRTCGIGSLESHSSALSGASQGSMDMGDVSEQPSTDCLTRFRSLQQCAHAITELVRDKIDGTKQLEAFSIQLVNLAIWKQALHICHTQAASAVEGSPSQGSIAKGGLVNKQQNPNSVEAPGGVDFLGIAAIGSHTEREFLVEVGRAEELAGCLGPIDGSTEMPDPMEIIFQSALALGRTGAVDELMGDIDSAVLLYSKAVRLLFFLLVEAPSLILNPPFSLTNSDRFRLRSYIDILNNRQSQSRSQRMALLKYEDQPSL
ncbi:serine/threonine-protein kinase ATG1c isoform X1 [Amborella trichopoda]|uniref:Protein kinase domain-containing protein n=2 Tax=Amborella trichopoda TaxID=13333 RepID=W1PK13_AMBTC|nr:serine/threonine-protein kinase ATG1c isoform X1 [Amborella trichopoda]ERN08074.1 hypothetical protein AMTR_s00012p00264650 [Amborella trichopoda]|eukprot:XP_006846399.1 serine/threonine-protein kinase ATG1c isoform X1 [Amborella trichopoda]